MSECSLIKLMSAYQNHLFLFYSHEYWSRSTRLLLNAEAKLGWQADLLMSLYTRCA